jgi:hypothetical protein
MPDRIIYDGPDGLEVHAWPNRPGPFSKDLILAIVKRGKHERGMYAVLGDGQFYRDGVLKPISNQAFEWLRSLAAEFNG